MALLAFGAAPLAGCITETEMAHGIIISDQALAQIQPGSSEEQVLLVMGTPSTTAMADRAYYYISQRSKRPVRFMDPTISDQRVVAVYFNEQRRVERVANYGLQDGKVFDFISRKEPTAGAEQSALRQFMRAMLATN